MPVIHTFHTLETKLKVSSDQAEFPVLTDISAPMNSDSISS